MSDPIRDIRDELQETLQKGISEQSLEYIKKQVKDICGQISEDIHYSLEDNLAVNLSFYVQRMAEDAIEQLLLGNEELMRGYLHCRKNGYTGRDTDRVSLHGGKLFETHFVELRRKIVEAHADLLRTERVLDLEAQRDALIKQIQQLETRNQSLIEEVNQWRPRF